MILTTNEESRDFREDADLLALVNAKGKGKAAVLAVFRQMPRVPYQAPITAPPSTPTAAPRAR